MGATILTLTMNPSLDVSVEVPSLAAERKLRSDSVRYEPGGGGINVARGVRRLGGDACALFPAGDSIGRMVGALLEEEDVPFTRIPIPGVTRQSFAVFVEELEELYHFVLPGPTLTADDVEHCIEAVVAREPAADYLVASGSLPPGVGEDFYGRLTRLIRRKGTRVVLDTHGAALDGALDAGVFLAKPNLRELQELTGATLETEEDWRRESRAVVEGRNLDVLALTLGSDGVLLTTREEQIYLRPPAVEVVSPVGAGDSFLAVLVARLAEGASMREALAWGVAGSAAAVQTPATELFRPDEVHRLFEQIMNDMAQEG